MGPDIAFNGPDSSGGSYRVAFAATARNTNATGALVHRRHKTPADEGQLRWDWFHRAALQWCGYCYFRGG